MSERLRQFLPAAIGLVLFGAALEVLRLELHAVTWQRLTVDILSTPVRSLVLAVVLCALNYGVLTGYDFLAFRYIGKSLRPSRIAVTSFLAYAIANNVGFAALSGASVRYRFYSRWGVTADELTRLVFSYSVTFWLGLLALGGVSLTLVPLPIAGAPTLVRLAPVAGSVLIAAVTAYVVATFVRRAPLRLRSFEIPLPSPWVTLAQLATSSADWALAGAVLYVLLPPSGLPFLAFLGSFLVAVLVGMLSHVPGGLGVFEGLMVLMLGSEIKTVDLAPALVVYRVVYYLLPLSAAMVGLVIDEVRQRRHDVARATAVLGQLTEQVAPRVLALFIFFAGVVLLLSGATPAAPGRLRSLSAIVPLPVIEASHFAGSIAGTLLLLISQAVYRRLDAAYYVAVWTIAVGITAALLKGIDYEEALILTAVLAVLWRSRAAFDRPASFFDTRFSPGWVLAVVGAVGTSVWLGLFAFRHIEATADVWWRFELRAQAPRFLRASVGAAIALLLFAVGRLLRPAPHDVDEPTGQDLADADRVIATQPSTMPYLVYLRDKAVIFNASRTGFVMYAVQGRTWVALGDPVGPPDCVPGLIRAFLERCDDLGGRPVFYQVTKDNLHHYADLGLTFVKLGEEARVDLSQFTVEGHTGKMHRQALRRFDRDGCAFRVAPAAEVPRLMGQLRAVSDAWLHEKGASEKGFSLGFFDEAYLERFPVALIERAGEILAFANLWPGRPGGELSMDLMRYRPDAPKSAMDMLLVQLLMWGQAQGYRWFALGMAPLAGVEPSPVASLWNRLAGFVYEHADAVYSFQGLRAYKQKYDPIWEPRYLAYQGGFHLPRLVADVSALIAGGYRRIFTK